MAARSGLGVAGISFHPLKASPSCLPPPTRRPTFDFPLCLPGGSFPLSSERRKGLRLQSHKARAHRPPKAHRDIEKPDHPSHQVQEPVGESPHGCGLQMKESQVGRGSRKSPQASKSSFTHSSPATTPRLSDQLGSVSKHLLQVEAGGGGKAGRKFPTGSLAIQRP